MNLVEHRKFVCTDALNNNNKFWEFKYHDDETLIVTYGRVGKTAQTDAPKKVTRKALDTLISSKLKGKTGKPGYREIEIVAEAVTVKSETKLQKEVVKQAAISQLAGDNKILESLIGRLVEANRHELIQSSGGQMNIDLNTGIISTPVGIVTKKNVDDARNILSALAPFVQSGDFDAEDFIKNLNSYLMLVPQQVGHSRGWHRNFFSSTNTLVSQNTLLDQLESSADLAEARAQSAKDDLVAGQKKAAPNLFDAELSVVEDPATIAMIKKMFKDSSNSVHQSRNLTPVRFYEVKIGHSEREFESKLHNKQLLWHGTRMFNVLSILKNGLIVPKSGGSYHVTGRMFGDGLYFSDQSTKSLNYSYGYWDRGTKDKNCFMFLFEVAMGKSYTPSRTGERLPKAGYDSTFAKAGVSGVMNNEMIVYRTSQAKPRYLIEFEEK